MKNPFDELKDWVKGELAAMELRIMAAVMHRLAKVIDQGADAVGDKADKG